VNTAPTLEDNFPKRIGGLRFSETTLHLGTILNNAEITDTIKVYNNSEGPISLSISNKLPDYLKLDIQPAKVESNAQALIIVSYSASLRKEFGFVLDRIMLNTNDREQPEKNLNITATMKEYFPPNASSDSLLPAKVRIAESSFNFGKIQQGEKAVHDYVFFNDGQHDLLIHHSKTNCGCVRSEFSKQLISPGDSAFVSLEFDSFGKEGDISNEVTIFVNDPVKPEIKLTIQGAVWK